MRMQPAKTAQFFVKRMIKRKQNKDNDKPSVVDQFDIMAF